MKGTPLPFRVVSVTERPALRLLISWAVCLHPSVPGTQRHSENARFESGSGALPLFVTIGPQGSWLSVLDIKWFDNDLF